MSIIHTGDLLDKKAPDLQTAEYWIELQEKVHDCGGFIKILAGNHEQEIWQNINNGENYGLTKSSLDSLCELIESLDLFYVDGPLLFIHSYPTVEFLQALLHYQEVTGNHLNRFNADHYKKAFKSVEALNQYSYIRRNTNENYLLYDPENIETYCRKNGSEIARILSELEIDCIIHGHRPQRSGIQIDHEFNRWIPGIRMIGNDTRVRLKGIGATLVRMDVGRALELIFINSSSANKKNRKKIRHLLRRSAPVFTDLQQQELESHQCDKLKKQIDTLSQEYTKNHLHAESKLQEQRTSLLLLQEQLREQNELHREAEKDLKSIQEVNQQLEKELLKHDESQPQLDKELPTEMPDLPVMDDWQQNEQLLIIEQALKASELSRVELQQGLEESNHTRKQAVDYLRICHEASQNMTQELKQCENDKLKMEQSHAATIKQEAGQPGWVRNVYVAVISSILTGAIVFYLF